MSKEVYTVRISEDMSLVHYLNLKINESDDLIPQVVCNKHSHCTLTLCGRHTHEGITTDEEVTCMECIMEINSFDPVKKEARELETVGKS